MGLLVVTFDDAGEMKQILANYKGWCGTCGAVFAGAGDVGARAACEAYKKHVCDRKAG